MGKHRIDWWIVVVAFVALGCGGGSGVDVSITSTDGDNSETSSLDPSEPGTPAAATEKRGTIGYSAMDMGNPFFQIIADNLRREAKAAGFDLIVENAGSDVKAQSEHLDAFIAKRVAAIVLNPCDSRSAGPSIKKANEQGIPVFTCDTQCVAEGIEIAGHVGTDNFGGGKLAGEAMIEVLGGTGGKVFVVDFQAESCVLRVDGFREVIDAYNKGREKGRIEIVGQQDGGGEPNLGFSVTSAAIQANPDLAGLFAINDPSGLGAYTALEQAGKTEQVTIVAFDGEKQGRQAIKDGKFFADPIQFPDRMGVQTVEKILKYLKGEEFEAVTLLPTVLYRKADADKDPELE
ncbi:MAG: substrate-binding domain-containing protein, partial [Pirellulaceae bacterium]|nr:substrate-binding domain-containing protein [Pirellulaceae bacterium]